MKLRSESELRTIRFKTYMKKKQKARAIYAMIKKSSHNIEHSTNKLVNLTFDNGDFLSNWIDNLIYGTITEEMEE